MRDQIYANGYPCTRHPCGNKLKCVKFPISVCHLFLRKPCDNRASDQLVHPIALESGRQAALPHTPPACFIIAGTGPRVAVLFALPFLSVMPNS